MTRIFIENNELDISKGLSYEITYSIDDIKRIDSKTTSFSKTIVLPGTANNNKIFGNIFAFNNANDTNELSPNVLYNFDASVSAVARIEVNGLQIIKGVLRLLEIIQVNGNIEYECAIFGELGGFISALGNKKIEDLDFSAYDRNWTWQNITASWDAINGSGVYFPLIEYNQESPNDIDFNFTAFRPAFYVKEILEKIIASSGYTWDFPFINTDFFKRLVVPNNQLGIYALNNTTLLKATFNNYTTTVPQNFPTLPLPMTTVTLGNFLLQAGNTSYLYNSNTSVIGKITATVSGSLNAGGFAPTTSYLRLKRNGVTLAQQAINVNTNPTNFNITLTALDVTYNLNDTMSVTLDNLSNSVTINSGTLEYISNTETLIPVNYDELISMNKCLPSGVFQRDFFVSMLKMFNLMITEDKYKEKHLIIKPYKDFYDGTMVDWSDKMDRSRVIKQKPMSEVNARYYNFKYKQDADFYNENYFKRYNEGYGDRLYDNNLEFAKDTEENEIIFASTVLYKTTANDKVYSAIFKRSNQNTAKDKMASVIRILQAQKITGVSSWHIRKQDSGNISPTLTVYGYAGHLYFNGNLLTPTVDINFGAPKEINFSPTTYPSDNLFNTYYSPYMAEITNKDSRLLTAYFKLTDLDIFNLDFAKFVYIDGGLYRLIKVYDYTPESNEVTKVDLLRVINKTY